MLMCKHLDRHATKPLSEGGTICGHPLPCPYHTAIIEISDERIKVDLPRLATDTGSFLKTTRRLWKSEERSLMPDLTTTQLYELLSPNWEREPELRPSELSYGLNYQRWRIGHRIISDDHAAQLCESQMVRWLATHKAFPTITEHEGQWTVEISSPTDNPTCCFTGKRFSAATLIQALSAACTAVLNAKETNK